MRGSNPTPEEIEKAKYEMHHDSQIFILELQKSQLMKLYFPKYKLSGNVFIDPHGFYSADKIEIINDPAIDAVDKMISARWLELINEYETKLGLK